MKKRIAIISALCLFLFLVGRFAWLSWRFHEVERNFHLITKGQSSGEVVDILGAPTYHAGECLQDLKISTDCAKEFVYGPFLAPLNPEYYVVDFSSNDRVINAEHLMSP
jgi:hypothetical protein